MVRIKCSVLFSSVHFSSAAQLCPTLCDPMNRSTPGLPVHHQLLEFTQTHVHWVSDAIQPSHPLLFPSLPTLKKHHTRYVSMMASANGLFWMTSLADLKSSFIFQNKNVPTILEDRVAPGTIYHDHIHFPFSCLLHTFKFHMIPCPSQPKSMSLFLPCK